LFCREEKERLEREKREREEEEARLRDEEKRREKEEKKKKAAAAKQLKVTFPRGNFTVGLLLGFYTISGWKSLILPLWSNPCIV
jgi:F0F1-type ATP synthase assembly protein I